MLGIYIFADSSWKDVISPSVSSGVGVATAGEGVWSSDAPQGKETAASRTSPPNDNSVSLEQGMLMWMSW